MQYCPSCSNPIPSDTRSCPICGMLISPYLPLGFGLQGNRYTIDKPLGRGGFGITYLAANTVLNKPVAIKELFIDGSSRGRTDYVLPPLTVDFKSEKERFLQEARMLGHFEHPSIVRVLDAFEENNTAYLVMEALQGETLAERIARLGALSPGEVMMILEKLMDGLEVVHKENLLHRDIKPDNIFLTLDGRAVLIDFGTARKFTADKTSSHTRMVTPGYAPLEQYASHAKVGAFTDIYALGATLHHALTGIQPPPVTDRLAGAPLADLPAQTPKPLFRAIYSALEVKVSNRPTGISALRSLFKIQTTVKTETAESAPNEADAVEYGNFITLGHLVGHQMVVNSVAFSPSSEHILTGSWDNTAKLWDAITHSELHTFKHSAQVWSVAFSPNGDYIITGSKDNTAKLWDINSVQLLRTLAQSSYVLSVAFSPKGDTLLTGGYDKSVRLWSIHTGDTLRVLLGHSAHVFSVGFSPSANMFVTGSGDGTARLWDTDSGKLIRTLSGHKEAVYSAVFSPSGKYILTGSRDGTAQLWDGATGSPLHKLAAHVGGVNTVAFSLNEEMLLTGGQDKTAKLWNLKTMSMAQTLTGHSSYVQSVAFSPRGERLLTASADKTVRIWGIKQA